MGDDDVRFRFKLASHLGIPNPFLLDHILTESDFRAWADYLRVEPLLADRAELQLALLISKVHNIFAKEPLRYEDFMITSRKKKSKKEEFEEKLRSAFGLNKI
ncbi:hypothetical protein [Campylobacter sp. RM16190]|uniref:phage tail assembly protein T n=1 Tax=Campylobacter sp. RM16190 TaxID=1705727 RepID=UPI0014740C7F|nr:hypothetical protein [Campylobacter sp. RM16190]